MTKAAVASPELTFTPTAGPVGTVLQVHGDCPGSQAGDAISLNRVSDGAELDQAVQLGNTFGGHVEPWDTTLTVHDHAVTTTTPPGILGDSPVSAGDYEVRLYCEIGSSFKPPNAAQSGQTPTQRSDATVIKAFTVTDGGLTYTLSKTSGPIGSTVHVTGSGCPQTNPRQPFDFSFDVADGPGRANVYQSNPDGTFSVDYVVPEPRAGEQSSDEIYPTLVYCFSKGQEFDGADFQITGPTYTLSPTSGLPGTLVQISGLGCFDGDPPLPYTATLTFGGHPASLLITAGPAFTFSGSFRVPTVGAGSYSTELTCPIQDNFSPSGVGGVRLTGTAPFSVNASPPKTVAVDPSTNLVDRQLVTVTGAGYPANLELGVVECAAGATDADQCDLNNVLRPIADDSGAFALDQYMVKRILPLPTGPLDCASGEAVCEIVASTETSFTRLTAASAPISFDPSVPPQQVLVSVDPSGVVDPAHNTVTLHGTVTCTSPTTVTVFVDIAQTVDGHLVTGLFSSPVQCTGTTSWSATSDFADGVFTDGPADAAVTTDFDASRTTATVQLSDATGPTTTSTTSTTAPSSSTTVTSAPTTTTTINTQVLGESTSRAASGTLAVTGIPERLLETVALGAIATGLVLGRRRRQTRRRGPRRAP